MNWLAEIIETAAQEADKQQLCTLCVDGVAIAVCSLNRDCLKVDAAGEIQDAIFDAWTLAGFDVRRLLGRRLKARPPTEEEALMWLQTSYDTRNDTVLLGHRDGVGTA
jgi:hypothetical protein